MKRTDLRRFTPLRSRGELLRSRALASAGSRRSHDRDPVPLSTRRAVQDRSGGVCECGCGKSANHIHHRQLRSQGGTNDATNLLHLSHHCHERAHRNPQASTELGLIVPSWLNPADVPVHRRPA